MTDGSTPASSTCGATATDRFCITCGVPLAGATRFCPRLGTAVPSPVPELVATTTSSAAGSDSKTPWIVAVSLSIIASAGVIYSAIGRDGLASGGPIGTPPALAAANGALPGRAPDISGMTPREQFARLNDRVMAAAETGDTATVINFWPMAFGAYQQLSPDARDIDARYHMASLHLLVGQFPAVLALTDTIMTESPDNLVGWYLRSLVADFQGDSTRAREARSAFDRLYPTEIAKPRGEYIDHRDVLEAFSTRPGAN